MLCIDLEEPECEQDCSMLIGNLDFNSFSWTQKAKNLKFNS